MIVLIQVICFFISFKATDYSVISATAFYFTAHCLIHKFTFILVLFFQIYYFIIFAFFKYFGFASEL